MEYDNKPHLARWHNVNHNLPKDSNWKIVRCINQDECSAFYFMAFCNEEKKWRFFDDEYEDSMQVTHWLREPDIEFDIIYNKKDDIVLNGI